MNRSLRHGLIAAAAVLVAVGLIVVVLPFLIPLSTYKAELEAEGSRATGRALKIEGPLRIAFFPSPGIDAQNVTLANVPGGRAAHLAEAESVHVALRLMPLFFGRAEISAITLESPQVHFEVDEQGEANWTLTRRHTGQQHAASIPSDLHIESITLSDGRVTYQSARSDTLRSLDQVRATVVLPAADHSASVHGSFVERGTAFKFSAGLDDTHKLLAGEPAKVSLALNSNILTSDFRGIFLRNGDCDGAIAFDTPSFRNLIAQFGRPVKVSGGLGRLSLHAHLSRRPHLTRLSDAQLSLDGMTAKGDLSIATVEHVPALTGRLDVDHLDLNPYLGVPHRHQGPHEEGWSTKPIRLDVLKAVNANLALHAGSLDVRHLSVEDATLHVTLQDAHLSADLPRVSLYGGDGAAHLDVDASGAVPSFTNRLSFRRVDASGFLADTIGVDRIAGTATLELSATAHGDNADAIMRSLSGRGAVKLANGQIHGVSLGDIAHTVEAVLHGSAISDESLTSFAHMGGSFTLDRGVLQTEDFRLASSVLVAEGEGAVDIGGRSLDFRIVPRVLLQRRDYNAAYDGDPDSGRYGVPVPVHIQGPWSHLHYGANFSSVFTGVLQNLESGRAPFKDLFGHTEHASGVKKKHKTVGDMIENMLGIH